MQRSSWIALGVLIALSSFLFGSYLLSRSIPTTLTKEQAVSVIETMKEAVARKDVNAIMGKISPASETRIADMNPDQARLFLARAFRGTGKLSADVSNLDFQGGKEGEASLDFDLTVKNEDKNMSAFDYTGRISLRLKLVEVSQFLGMYHTREWRIVDAKTSGPSPASFGDL